MAEQAKVAIVLPLLTGSPGDNTAGFSFQLQDGTVVYVPATVIVDTSGNEIGTQILDCLNDLVETNKRSLAVLAYLTSYMDDGFDDSEYTLEG